MIISGGYRSGTVGRILVWWVVACVVFGASCRYAEAGTPISGQADNTLHFDSVMPFVSLFPGDLSRSWGSSLIFPLVFNSLALPKQDGNLEPDLAESWEYDKSDHIWQIHLRKGAVFHDGSPVTAEDVVFSLETMIAALQPHLIDSVCNISAETDLDIVICLNKDSPDFLWNIASLDIMPRGVSAEVQKERPVGSGPYRVEEKIGDHTVRLRAFERFYGGMPHIEQIEYRFLADKERTWTRLLAGNTDFAMRMPFTNFRMMKNIEHKFRITGTASPFISIMLFNTHDPLFSDPRVRKAISMGIDRQGILQEILHDYGKVATGPIGVDSPFARPDARPIPYEPMEAKRLLEAAGWRLNEDDGIYYRNGIPFDFTLLCASADPVDKQVARFIQLGLNELGVRTRLRYAEWARITSKYFNKRDFQAVLTATPGVYYSDEYLVSFWKSNKDSGSKAGLFKDRQLNVLFDAMENCIGADKKNMLHRIENRLLELTPAAFLYHKFDFDMVSRRVQTIAPFDTDIRSIRNLYRATLHPRPE